MQRLNELKEAYDPFSLLIYGPAKSGKTFLSGTAGDKHLFISNGMGDKTLRSKFFKDKVKANPFIEVIGIDDINKTERSFDQIEKLIIEGLKSPEIEWITIDDATAHTQSAMIKAIDYNAATSKSTTIGLVKRFDLVIPAVQDYGTEIEYTRQFYAWAISECKAYSKHFVLLCHERNIFKKGKNIGDQPELIKTTPYFTGADKNPDRIPALFDYVWHTEVTGGGEHLRFYARTVGDESLIAGTRDSQFFPERWQNPNLLEAKQALVSNTPIRKGK